MWPVTSTRRATGTASGLRTGSTLEYLLRGMTFDAMKAKGRWMGDSFLQLLFSCTYENTP